MDKCREMESISKKYRYAANSEEAKLMYVHRLLQTRQFADLSGRRVLAEEVGRVKQLIFGGLN